MKLKIIVFAAIAWGVSLLQLCGNSPTELSSPEYAASALVLVPSTSEKSDTIITDSVGREIQLIVTYTLGYYIDSVHIDIFSNSAFLAGGAPDSQLFIHFNENDLRDTTRFNVQFASAGTRHFVVRTFKHRGFTSFCTAIAQIIPSAAMIGNHAPRFISNAPKRGYHFKGGDLIRFPVKASDIDGDSLSFSFNAPVPRPTTARLQNDYFEWQSKSGDKGIYPIIFTVFDGSISESVVATIAVDTTFNIPPLITSLPPPVARTNVMYEYRPEASDEESPVLIWKLSGSIPEGLHFDSLTGQILWMPGEGIAFGGPMWLTVIDGGIPPQSDSQRIMITVEGVNRPPVAVPRTVATDLETPVTIFLFASDPDRDDTVFTFEITEPPLHGTAAVSGSPSSSGRSSITYTPATAFRGVDTIRFIARDAIQGSDTATIKIYVASDNQKPVATGQEIASKEDTPLSLQLLAEDVENSTLNYLILKNPRHGVLDGSSKDRIYTPHGNFFGADTFTFIANDGQLDSDPAMVIIKIVAVNDTPVVGIMGVPTALNTPVAIMLSASDPDDSVFSFRICGSPSHGVIDTSALPSLVYTPADGYKGVDTLMYCATDAQGCSSVPASIVILIGSDNTRPTANSGSVIVAEDSSIVFELQGSDAEGSPLTFIVTGQPRHGKLTGTESLRKYQPNGDFYGIDTFTFTVSDQMLVSEPATMTINVTPVNDLPIAGSQSTKASVNTPVVIQLFATDIDDTLFSYFVTAFPKHGTLDTASIGSGRLQYTPDMDYTGGDTVKFIARDASGGESRPAIITVIVGAANEVPVANPQNVTINEDEATTIFLTGSDVETSNLVFSFTGLPSLGSFEGVLPNIVYRPSKDVNGVDSFFFTVNDGFQLSAPARVLITILPVNDAPVAKHKTLAAKLNEPVTVTLEADDEDGISFTYQVTDGPHHGTIDTSGIKNGNVVYTPSLNYKGYDTLFYRAFDELLLASRIELVIIGVALGNQAPVALPQTVRLEEGDVGVLTLKGLDLENAPLTYTITQNPKHGSVGTTPPNLVYTPFDPNYNGFDTLKFTVSDGRFTSAAAVVDFIIEPVNDAPIGNSTTVTTSYNTPATLSVSGWDPDGGTWVYRIITMPAHGKLDTTNLRFSSVIYTPTTNYSGRDTVRFVVIDQTGLKSDPAVIAITVKDYQPNRPPVAKAVVTPASGKAPLKVTCDGSGSSDPDGDALKYSWVFGDTWQDTGVTTTHWYMRGGTEGTYTLKLTVTDGNGGSDDTTITMHVTGNLPPTIATAASASPNTVTGTTTDLSVLGDDDMGESILTYTWETTGTPPAAVTFSPNGNNTAKHTAATFTRAGNYTFQVTVKDGENLTVTSSVAVTVKQTLKNIVVSPSNVSVEVSQTRQFGATARDQFGTSLAVQPTFTWSVVNGGTGTVNTSGLYSAGPVDGNATVRATSGSIHGDAAVTVTAAAPVLTTIAVSPLNATIEVSETQLFTASGLDQYGDPLSPQPSITWSVESGVGTVSAGGLYSAGPAAGSATVRATSGSIHGDAAVTVTAAAPVLATITVTPSSPTVGTSETQQFTASGLDQYGDPLSPQPSITWSVESGVGTVSAGGLYSAGPAAGSATVRAASGSIYGEANVTVTEPVDNDPTIATPASATPNPVTGTAAELSVLGADDGGESNLTYTWATTETPPAAVSFSANGDNAAKVTTATFTKAGNYTFEVTVKDASDQSVISTVAVTVDQTTTTVVVAPSPATVVTGQTQQFTATASDQFDDDITNFTWSVEDGGVGTISTGGLYSAGPAAGSATVRATSGTIYGEASVTVTEPVDNDPTIATPASATPDPVTGTTTELSVLGADDGGEANLTYTWAATGTPPAAVTFGVNGTNASKTTAATFTKAGSYTFQVTVKDASDQTVTSSVVVTVNQTATSVDVAPSTITVPAGGTQAFTATVRDQFTTALTPQPSIDWSVSGNGDIDGTGLFTAGLTAGPATVTASGGGVDGTASVTVE